MYKHSIWTKSILYLAMLLFAAWSLFPLIVTISTSLGPNLVPLAAGSPFFTSVTVDNYVHAFQNKKMVFYLGNTAIISVTATVLSVVCSVSAAYAFARFKFRGSGILSRWILSMRLIPSITFLTPFFIMFVTLNLINTHMSLIIVYTAFLLPFSIWILTSFIHEIPPEAEEAAQVDGLTRFQVLYKIILPQIWPAIGVVSMLNLVAAWNEFLFALTLVSAGAATLPVGITSFIEERSTAWGQITAAAIVTMIVPIAISIAINKYLLRGLTLGGEKQ
jgi:multiple sugar transport system permease protein